MRRALIPALVLLAVAPAAVARDSTVKVPPLFEHQLAALHKKHVGPVLLPETMTVATGRLYPTVDAVGRTGYELDLGAAAGCHGANACFVAEFSARHSAPFNTTRVKLTGGVTGYFRPLSCGGSCSPPSIEFKRSGFTYEIQANVGTQRTEKALLIAMANSAIVHGGR
jgi:hypothetical protein